MKIGFFPADDDLEKAMTVYPIGTVRMFGSKRYKKIAKGKWRPTSDAPHAPSNPVGTKKKFQIGRNNPRGIEYEKKEYQQKDTKIVGYENIVGESGKVVDLKPITETSTSTVTGWTPVKGSFHPTGMPKGKTLKRGEIFETEGGVKYKAVEKTVTNTETGETTKKLGWEVQSKFDPTVNSLAINTMTNDDLKLLKEDAVYQSQFIKENQAFVGASSRRVHKDLSKIEYADIFQAGNEGFIKAVREMDLSRTVPQTFLSFVRTSMVNKMKDTVNQAMNLLSKEPASLNELVGDDTMERIDAVADGRVDRESGYLKDFQEKIDRATRAIEAELTKPSDKDRDVFNLLDRQYTATKVAKELGLKVGDVRKARTRRQRIKDQARKVGKVFGLLVEGNTPADISRKIGISKPAVSKMIKEKIAPIAEQYMLKSVYGKSFYKFLLNMLAPPKLVFSKETK